jgi:hypothetical protein
MPTKKQRRRREKDRRHEWEEVYVDEHGREVAVEENGAPADTRERPERAKSGATRRAPARAVQPPSWRRVLKRGLIFAPFMYLFLTVIDPDVDPTGRAIYTGQLLLLFIPFSYLVDTFMYRMWRRRHGEAEAADQPRKR